MSFEQSHVWAILSGFQPLKCQSLLQQADTADIFQILLSLYKDKRLDIPCESSDNSGETFKA